MTNQAAISFEHVSYYMKEKPILQDINGFFPKGQISTLVGPTGAGKTTVFKLCNSLKSPSSGKIYFNQAPIESYRPTKLRRRIGLALQDATMITGTVKENLALPLELQERQLTDEDARAFMHLVGLQEDLLKSDAKILSGGERQKLSIARTLINQPEVLLLDEITSMLDRVSTQEIEQLILKINQQYGTTIIWITHNVVQAQKLSDYTWVMVNGRILEAGKSDLLTHPQTQEVERFIKGDLQ